MRLRTKTPGRLLSIRHPGVADKLRVKRGNAARSSF